MIPTIGTLSQALVVASHHAFRDDMVNSLRELGFAVVSTEHIDQCISQIPTGPSLVVVQPDGFRFDQIVGILFALRRERPDVYAVLVTETPARYVKLVATDDNAPPPWVVPMPVLARTVFETVAVAATGADDRMSSRQARADPLLAR
jgi:hypothetical protein